MTIDYHKPQFTQLQVAEAAEVSVVLMRSWINRGVLKYVESDETAVGRSGHRLSARTAVRAALITAMNGIIPQDLASVAAEYFTENGTGDHPEAKATRNVGELFSEGETFLIVPVSGKPRVVCRMDDGTFYPGGLNEAAFVQPVDELWHRVMARLGRITPRVTRDSKSAARSDAAPAKVKVDA